MSPEEKAIRKDECLKLAASLKSLHADYKVIIDDLRRTKRHANEGAGERGRYIAQLQYRQMAMVEAWCALEARYP